MSIHDLAQHVQAHGRGNDTRLMHVTPKELGSLRALAQSRGGDLSTNPHTGLPEAGFLESMLPTLVGAGVGIATGNPFIGAAVGGGLGMAANKGSLQSGIMAGLGSYGFGSLGAGLAEAGGSALASEAAAAPAAMQAANIPAAAVGETYGAFGDVIPGTAEAASNASAAVPGAAAQPAYQAPSTWDKLTKGFEATKFDADYLKKNMFPLGLGAAGLLLGSQDQNSTNPVSTQQTPYVRPYTYSKTMNPNWGQPGQPYYSSQTMTPGTPIAAADTAGQTFFAAGGLTQNNGFPMSQQDHTQYAEPTQMPVGAQAVNADYDTPTNPQTGMELPRLAAGGPPNQAVVDYNNALMQRAQQEYSQPTLGVMQPRGAGLAAAAQQQPYAPNMTPIQQPQSTSPATPVAVPGQPGQVPMSWSFAPDGSRVVQSWGYGPAGDNGMGGGDGASAAGTGGGGSSGNGGDGPGGGYAGGGMLGHYSDGGHLLRGPGDGISDSIPASIGGHQPARLANNEFVIPARIVSEIGNGSTDAGAKRLYDMMAKVQARRKKTVGSGNIAVDSGAHKELNRL